MSKPKQKVYFISGLGADERVFYKLNIPDVEPIYIQWIEPLKNEELASYATRLSVQVMDENPIVLGLSFGGIVAVEIAKQIPVKKLVLLSTVKTLNEIPVIYRLAGKLGLHRLLPPTLLKVANPISDYLFGAFGKADKLLLKNILKDTDSIFLKWAINSIVRWQNIKYPEHFIHIHGTSDRILPIARIKNCIHIYLKGVIYYP